MEADQVIADLKQRADEQTHAGMARFGISTSHALGVSIPVLRKMAKAIGCDHALALTLWASGIHEARILASMIADPRLVSPQEMDEWVNDFDSCDVCDQVCGNLFEAKEIRFFIRWRWNAHLRYRRETPKQHAG